MASHTNNLPWTDTGERTLPQLQPDGPKVDLLTPEGWKAEVGLTLVLIIYQNGLSVRRH